MTPSLKECGTPLRHWEKRAYLFAIPQCPDPGEPMWKVCFSTRWVRRWKRFGMTRVYVRGTGGSSEHGGAYISLSRLACCGWARPTSAVHFSPAARHRAIQSWPVCRWITWANKCTPSSPLCSEYTSHPTLLKKPSPEHPCMATWVQL